ncbi:MAG: family 16 glycosylhydrolase [Bacteroidales bacterium]
MKLNILILAISFFISTSCENQDQGWHLVWNDEFENEGLPDPARWAYDIGYIANNEKQYYTESRLENARVENGQLIIEAHRESWNDFDYTSARLVTRGRSTWTYGRFEIRAKVPGGVGTWPAIWMLGENISEIGWPACGEIDIMEHVGFDPHNVHGNVHTKAYNHMIGTNKGGTVELENPAENFHIYAIEWFEDRIDFYVDENKYFTFEKESEGGNDVWPFDKPHYLLLNLAIGGDWGGSRGIDDSVFPHRFLIDYVRVYEWK